MENNRKRQLAILGSTGSIGTQTLQVVEEHPECFEVYAITAGTRVDDLIAQARKFMPEAVVIADETKYPKLKEALSDLPIKTYGGYEAICQIVESAPIDIVVTAMVGFSGLRPTINAIKAGKAIALANKETLVMAGDIVMQKAKNAGVNIIPVDSEHCAIHQCIKDISQVEKLIVTASGGPFLRKSIEDMKNGTVTEALAHPRWNMGRKITVDSATLMNKGLEIIEAHHLFNMPYDKIDVVIHPQSIIHSAIEYVDGSVIAQIGLPSMHIPIQYAITYPERYEGIKSKSFSFSEIARLDFEKPDYEKFPTLKLAYQAGKTGGSATVCLNAANEEAVFAFLDGKIKLFDIYTITEKMMSKHEVIKTPTIDEIFAIDNEIRIKTKELIKF